MEKISLEDLVVRLGQATVARALGVKPASIAKAIRTRRNIVVTVAEDGSFEAQETRPFPSQEYVSLPSLSNDTDGSKSPLDGDFQQPKGCHLP
ncbi:Cro/Cl family transcriptional regulator [Pseudomonas sp. PB120]|uniref:Cro/CI family transcriptional regulator n=1 Tax=Pseudomonas sp. PB120 TaxID=2494700 RepID=UPI0012FE2FE7|nr:Cro/CI family transcriptional regulator [Pseudomonas sp. PB120]MVV51899.1 Cro/Cl family transcriptional regulator [Pseudomonas sp. PB120]